MYVYIGISVWGVCVYVCKCICGVCAHVYESATCVCGMRMWGYVSWVLRLCVHRCISVGGVFKSI